MAHPKNFSGLSRLLLFKLILINGPIY